MERSFNTNIISLVIITIVNVKVIFITDSKVKMNVSFGVITYRLLGLLLVCHFDLLEVLKFALPYF